MYRYEDYYNLEWFFNYNSISKSLLTIVSPMNLKLFVTLALKKVDSGWSLCIDGKCLCTIKISNTDHRQNMYL